jgi:hypothetical protein
MSPAWSLQQSIFAGLSADAALMALLGPGRVYDDVPQGTPLPYVTLGQTTLREASTATEDGAEHSFTIHVWSDARGKKGAHALLDAIRAVLHDRPLTLAGHRLVNLRHESSEVRRHPDGTMHGLARFRAVTEPA